MASTVPLSVKRRSALILLWATVPVIGLAIYVQSTGTGIDLLVFGVACLLLLALERTVGDWLGEVLGAGVAGILFALFVASTIYYFFSDKAGRSHTDNFFLAAEKRGYHTVYYEPSPPDAAQGIPSIPALNTASSSVNEAPIATNGASGPLSALNGGSRGPTGTSTGFSAASGSGGGGSVAGGRTESASTQGAGTAAPESESPPEHQQGPQNPERAPQNPEQVPQNPKQATQNLPTSSLASVSLRAYASSVWSHWFPESTISVPTTISLDVSPRTVAVARRVVLRAVVTAGGAPVVHGTVEFSVNGSGAGRIILDANGTAATHFSTYIQGAYTVTARYAGSTGFAPSVSSPIDLTVGRDAQ
jgi:Big-like domain-containing protein